MTVKRVPEGERRVPYPVHTCIYIFPLSITLLAHTIVDDKKSPSLGQMTWQSENNSNFHFKYVKFFQANLGKEIHQVYSDKSNRPSTEKHGNEARQPHPAGTRSLQFL